MKYFLILSQLMGEEPTCLKNGGYFKTWQLNRFGHIWYPLFSINCSLTEQSALLFSSIYLISWIILSIILSNLLHFFPIIINFFFHGFYHWQDSIVGLAMKFLNKLLFFQLKRLEWLWSCLFNSWEKKGFHKKGRKGQK